VPPNPDNLKPVLHKNRLDTNGDNRVASQLPWNWMLPSIGYPSR
jgi:hypothetical protein